MAAGHSGYDGTMNTINSYRVGLKRDWAFRIASAATTIYGDRCMSGGMAMPGNWTMSMAWMRMQDQSWLASMFSFLGMWVVMMAAMMLPALVPALLHFRTSLRRPETVNLNTPTALVGAGYFFVWALMGAAVYPVGMIVTNAEMRWPAFARSVPLLTGIVFLFAGSLQFTAWKARQLCRCRGEANCESM